MKSISIELGGKLRSVVAPTDSAAYTVAMDPESKTAEVLIRMKKQSEHSALSAINAAKKEYPDGRWNAVGMSPWLETTGGVADSLNPYYKISFVYKNGDWNMVVTEDMTEFKMAQRDFGSTSVGLPEANLVQKNEIERIMKILTNNQGPKGRW